MKHRKKQKKKSFPKTYKGVLDHLRKLFPDEKFNRFGYLEGEEVIAKEEDGMYRRSEYDPNTAKHHSFFAGFESDTFANTFDIRIDLGIVTDGTSDLILRTKDSSSTEKARMLTNIIFKGFKEGRNYDKVIKEITQNFTTKEINPEWLQD